MVCCIQSKDNRAFFFDKGSVTGANYRNMLIRYTFPRFLALREDNIFIQNSASPHYWIPVRNYLDRNRPNSWIGRGGPASWPARSPDLTPCDLLLSGPIKEKVFSTLTESIGHLK